jgi:hypothetical protein
VGGGGLTDVEQVEARDGWIFRRSLGHVRMANAIVYAKIAVQPCFHESTAYRLTRVLHRVR